MQNECLIAFILQWVHLLGLVRVAVFPTFFHPLATEPQIDTFHIFFENYLR